MRRIILIALLCLAGCAPAATPTEAPTATSAPSATPRPTETQLPTATPVPPTETPAPTATLAATSTDTPTPEPTLPAAPSGYTVERLETPVYIVRLLQPAIRIRAEANMDAPSIGSTLDCGAEPAVANVVAKAKPSDEIWYFLGVGGWVPNSFVRVYDSLEKANAARATISCAVTGGGGSSGGSDFAIANSVWELAFGTDNFSGTCTGSRLPPYGKVQLLFNGNAMTWKHQVEQFIFAKAGTNFYSYSGPSAQNDGTVTMNLSFTSATTMNVTRSFVPSSDPTCTHNYTYSGTWQWNTP